MSDCERPGNKYAFFLGGGGVLPYISNIGYVLPKSVGFLGRFCIDFAHFGLESGMVFEGTMHLSFQSQRSKKEREICEFEMDFTKSSATFYCCPNLSNDDMIS